MFWTPDVKLTVMFWDAPSPSVIEVALGVHPLAIAAPPHAAARPLSSAP